jgi:ribonuclease HI
VEALLERAGTLQCKRMVIHSDSELMVRQLTGVYRVKDRGLKPHHARAVQLLKSLPFPCSVKHIPREENREADRLANLGIDEKIPVQVS